MLYSAKHGAAGDRRYRIASRGITRPVSSIPCAAARCFRLGGARRGFRPSRQRPRLSRRVPAFAARRLYRRFFRSQGGLGQLFGRPADLVSTASIRNPYFRQSVEQTKAVLYAAGDEKISRRHRASGRDDRAIHRRQDVRGLHERGDASRRGGAKIREHRRGFGFSSQDARTARTELEQAALLSANWAA